MTARSPISMAGEVAKAAANDEAPKTAIPANSARRRPSRSASTPYGSSRAANTRV